MQIEILKKSVERFRQVVDFDPVLPDGVRVTTAMLSARDASTGEPSDVFDGGPCDVTPNGRAVRFVVKGGEPGTDHVAEVVCTLSDGQVVAQDVLVRVEPGFAPAPLAKSPPAWVQDVDLWGRAVEESRVACEKSIADVTRRYYGLGGKVTEAETVQKEGARDYAGAYAQPHASVGTQARQARAYGRDARDKRVWNARSAGLPVAKCPECADGGEPAEVDMNDVALGKNVLKRGKMFRAANLLQGGVLPAGGDVTPIRVARLDPEEAKRVGKKYAVIPGDGNHRVAHMMISQRKGAIPVVVASAKVQKYDPDQPRDEGGRFGEGGGTGGGASDADKGPVVARAGHLGPEFLRDGFKIPPQSSTTKTPSADEQRTAFRQKIGEAARAEFGTDKPSRGQVQARSQDQKAKYGKEAKVWVWDQSSGSAMPGTVERDAKSDEFERSGQREDRQYVVQVPDLDKGGTRPVTAHHGDIAPRGKVKKSTLDSRRSAVHERVISKRKARLARKA